ncbi:DUF4129 domain-containing protein [Agromyces seonyuensis]|uniref:DUF4129 domain-containing protein n=1 Tax=Agromyces seonyuensis TaxID=2662446 RepID=A0A6I4NX97_9MICO|nr:DUF4129 domain-containing protein [Agromyces seonyuensis]MWB98868.1 DUF4129 domain-containing protein [Agromyces seonyuensis]
MVSFPTLPSIRFEPPVLPDGPEAREWILRELGEPRYRAAEPTPFDRLVSGFLDWVAGLFSGGGGSVPVLALVVAVIITALVVAAFAIFGRPRSITRHRAPVALFGGDDRRSAAELRRAADAAAAAGDWVLALEERFRAIVRGLDERELVPVHPGTTARAAARAAGIRFPALAGDLDAGAERFDGVRFLDAAAGAEDDARLRELDAALVASTPEPSAVPTGALQ